ncbi:hypothetical protein BJ508DRAFT_364231 [Ascobolus immersus RN42]|uniref:Uncharacterized protein n=1 Tax=Ascobolus immersus RN42 TaxID=1160509 RepID=A0A3N4HZE1_ASCIM|nr:hypothetical protein BJ508DRAFT_364231 [Ascobolus immersus RN42]
METILNPKALKSIPIDLRYDSTTVNTPFMNERSFVINHKFAISAATSAMTGLIHWTLAKPLRKVGVSIATISLGLAVGIILYWDHCRPSMLSKSSVPKDPEKEEETSDKSTSGPRMSDYHEYDHWMKDNNAYPCTWPNSRLLLREGPLHMRRFFYLVTSTMEDNGLQLFQFDWIALQLAREDRKLQKELNLPWNDADLRWRKVQEHSDWRKGENEEVMKIWKENEKEYPLHHGLLGALKELSCSIESWRFAFEIVVRSCIYKAAFEFPDYDLVDEVFAAYDDVFVDNRREVEEIRRALERSAAEVDSDSDDEDL